MESDPDQLHRQITMMKQSFFTEGFLSQTQFQQLEWLQDRDNPNFVQELFDLFFRDTVRQFAEIEKVLHQLSPSHEKKANIDRLLHRLKGSVISLGALKILDGVNKTRQYLEEDDKMEGVVAAFEEVKAEQANLKAKVEPYFQLLSQVGSSDTAERPK